MNIYKKSLVSIWWLWATSVHMRRNQLSNTPQWYATSRLQNCGKICAQPTNSQTFNYGCLYDSTHVARAAFKILNELTAVSTISGKTMVWTLLRWAKPSQENKNICLVGRYIRVGGSIDVYDICCRIQKNDWAHIIAHILQQSILHIWELKMKYFQGTCVIVIILWAWAAEKQSHKGTLMSAVTSVTLHCIYNHTMLAY